MFKVNAQTSTKPKAELTKSNIEAMESILKSEKESQKYYLKLIKKAEKLLRKHPNAIFVNCAGAYGFGLLSQISVNYAVIAMQLIIPELNNETKAKVQKIVNEINCEYEVNTKLLNKLKVLGGG